MLYGLFSQWSTTFYCNFLSILRSLKCEFILFKNENDINLVPLNVHRWPLYEFFSPTCCFNVLGRTVVIKSDGLTRIFGQRLLAPLQSKKKLNYQEPSVWMNQKSSLCNWKSFGFSNSSHEIWIKRYFFRSIKSLWNFFWKKKNWIPSMNIKFIMLNKVSSRFFSFTSEFIFEKTLIISIKSWAYSMGKKIHDPR